MNHFVIRQTRELVLSIQDVMRLHTGLRTENEAVTFSYHLLANDLRDGRPIDFMALALLDFGDKDKEVPAFPTTRRFSVDEENLKVVLEHFRQDTGNTRVRMAYLTRLVLAHARIRLPELKNESTFPMNQKEDAEVQINGIELIRSITELLLSVTENAQGKIIKIRKILEE